MHIGPDTLVVFDDIRGIPRRFPENDLALFAPQRNARSTHHGNHKMQIEYRNGAGFSNRFVGFGAGSQKRPGYPIENHYLNSSTRGATGQVLPSVTVKIWLAFTPAIRSTWPLGQWISKSAFCAPPKPKCTRRSLCEI